jgi:hypothetical protein
MQRSRTLSEPEIARGRFPYQLTPLSSPSTETASATSLWTKAR